jgi:hypothetical protein
MWGLIVVVLYVDAMVYGALLGLTAASIVEMWPKYVT